MNDFIKEHFFYTKVKNLFSQTSFKLREFQSNSTDLETLANGYKNGIAQEKVKMFRIL